MRLQKLSDGSVCLSQLNSWDVQTFRNLPLLADFSDHEAAERRLLPSPAIESDLTPEMAMDWVEYVIPELRDSFALSLGTVMADLEKLEPDAVQASEFSEDVSENEHSLPLETPLESSELFTLTIPADHTEHWFRAMNQARLVLSTRHGIDSEHLPDLASLLTSGKLEHWFQYELFVSLQGWLVEVVLDPE